MCFTNSPPTYPIPFVTSSHNNYQNIQYFPPVIPNRFDPKGLVLYFPKLISRMNLKIIYLPKLLYLLWVIPIFLPQRLFQSINSLAYSFVWNGSNPCFSNLSLYLPFLAGELCAPNFSDYYLASQLA